MQKKLMKLYFGEGSQLKNISKYLGTDFTNTLGQFKKTAQQVSLFENKQISLPTKEQKIEDPTYGYYTGKKPPAFEQRIGRRVDEHGSVVATDVKQVSKILKGGEKKLSGSTLANVKDTGLLSAPVVALSKTMTPNDVLLYDSAMETLLKNMTLFQNPDYKPTDAEVVWAQKVMNVAADINTGKIAPSIFLAALSIGIGILNAAAMSE